MSAIDEIKARIDIVDLVSETVQLRRSGKNYTGFCPFHPNTRTPAFVVFQETGTWRCFGQCNEGGDIIKFVQKKEGWDFNEALRYLAERAGVQLRAPTPQEQAAAEEHDALRSLLEEAVTFYRHQLLNSPAGLSALEYLHKRGLKDETVEAFGLGYAPGSWDATSNYFKTKGASEKDLLEVGLLNEREAEEAGRPARVFDRFRHRIMFPIRDERGRMAGFGARILNPEDVPKFLNSPQTPVFDKSRLLYGLDRARKGIRSSDQAVIVEGYLDVIALHQAGFTNAISPMGTALTEPQMGILKRFTRKIILALDPDAAGAKATLRGLQVARQSMDREADPVFDARGLLSYEARLQADIRVTTLPQGMDPDEVVNRDPQEWVRIIANAQPVVAHVMETLAAGQNIDDPKVKSDIARQVMPLIDDVADAIEREAYRQKLARLLRVDERAILTGEPRPRRGRGASSATRFRRQPKVEAEKQAAAMSTSVLPQESYCLGVLMRRPDLVFRVDRIMQEYGLPRLTSSDFQSSEHQNIFALVQESLDQDVSEPLNFVLNGLSMPLMDKADELLVKTEKTDPVEDRVLEDIMRSLLDLRRRNLRQYNEHLRYLMEEAQEQGDIKASEYVQDMANNTKILVRLDQAQKRFTSRVESIRS